MTDTGAASFAAGLDAMNQRVVEASRAIPEDQVRPRWIAAQDALRDTVRALDTDMLAREIVAPWGDRLPMRQIIEDELEHERDRVADIVAAVSAGRVAP